MFVNSKSRLTKYEYRSTIYTIYIIYVCIMCIVAIEFGITELHDQDLFVTQYLKSYFKKTLLQW